LVAGVVVEGVWEDLVAGAGVEAGGVVCWARALPRNMRLAARVVSATENGFLMELFWHWWGGCANG